MSWIRCREWSNQMCVIIGEVGDTVPLDRTDRPPSLTKARLAGEAHIGAGVEVDTLNPTLILVRSRGLAQLSLGPNRHYRNRSESNLRICHTLIPHINHEDNLLQRIVPVIFANIEAHLSPRRTLIKRNNTNTCMVHCCLTIVGQSPHNHGLNEALVKTTSFKNLFSSQLEIFLTKYCEYLIVVENLTSPPPL